MWFEQLTGFVEKSPQQVRANLTVKNNIFTLLGGGAFGNDLTVVFN